MSEENVEILRRVYAAYNAAWSAPNPREDLRVVFESSVDPEIAWETEASGPAGVQIFHGIDGVMEFFDLILEAFEYGRQVPERFIDCGDRLVVFVRTEARARTTGLELNEQWAHLVTMRDGKAVRWQQFRDRADALEAAGLSE
jgi:ketosteroid isomerase-like protein